MTPTYKVRNRNTGMFSTGRINFSHIHSNTGTITKRPYVKWTKAGKEWSSEKLLKAHLFKWVQAGGSTDNWEVIRLVYEPTKPVHEWIDQKMLMAIIKTK